MCLFQSIATSANLVTPGTLITPANVVGTLSLVTNPIFCGSYNLTNEAGETLANGGSSFGIFQSFNFCLSGGMLQRNISKSANNTYTNKKK